jgi:NTP pyrophosphatase (non-canonical NTP hydrolase)
MFDYIAETDKTASGVFTPEQVGIRELQEHLAYVVHAAKRMDKIKKALFRQRSREEAGLGERYLNDAGLVVPEYDADLFHGIIGSITEVGEQAEILQKYLSDGMVDIPNVREEIGDNLWYLSRLVKWARTSFADEMVRNIAKLRARHGQGGFNRDKDINRDLSNERKVLET